MRASPRAPTPARSSPAWATSTTAPCPATATSSAGSSSSSTRPGSRSTARCAGRRRRPGRWRSAEARWSPGATCRRRRAEQALDLRTTATPSDARGGTVLLRTICAVIGATRLRVGARRFALAATAALLAALVPAGVGVRAASSLPPVGHVWVVLLENEDYASTFTSTPAPDPYLRSLESSGVLIPDYFGIGHNSLDNYVALGGGQAPTPNTQGDCPNSQDVPPG